MNVFLKKIFAMFSLCFEVLTTKSDARQVFEEDLGEEMPESWPGIHFSDIQSTKRIPSLPPLKKAN
jgi:hypothetical protein